MGRIGTRSSRAWIFVSHSTKDLKSVRRIRNYLERRGTDPLLFFLKALSAEPELRSLLRREIDERNFFLLCNSRFARESIWVQEEVAYVKSRLSGKIFAEINLEDPWAQQKVTLDRLVIDTTVFLSYARQDLPAVKRFLAVLEDNDFSVFKTRLSVKSDWQEQI